ncbi:MAG: hypothetical protein ACETVR_04725, partial [Candidatus Bathyarchaeia archaeon]
RQGSPGLRRQVLRRAGILGGVKELSEVCILCGRKMGRGTQPYWIVDLEKAEVRGRAHKTCREKLRGSEYRATTRAVGDPPSRERILFARKMIRARESLEDFPWEQPTILKALILGYTFEASSAEELLNLPRLKELFSWWVHGSKIITEEQREEIKDWIREVS